jgi:hypothetical protein
MPAPTDGRTPAVSEPSAGRFALVCCAMAGAWLGILSLLRALGWLPGSLGEEPHFGYTLAIGMPLIGLILGLFRTRSLRSRSSG